MTFLITSMSQMPGITLGKMCSVFSRIEWRNYLGKPLFNVLTSRMATSTVKRRGNSHNRLWTCLEGHVFDHLLDVNDLFKLMLSWPVCFQQSFQSCVELCRGCRHHRLSSAPTATTKWKQETKQKERKNTPYWDLENCGIQRTRLTEKKLCQESHLKMTLMEHIYKYFSGEETVTHNLYCIDHGRYYPSPTPPTLQNKHIKKHQKQHKTPRPYGRCSN